MFCKRPTLLSRILLALAGLLYAFFLPDTVLAKQWRHLGPGIEYAVFTIKPPSEAKAGQIHFVRLNPDQVVFTFLLASELDRKPRTAADWAEEFKLNLAINAGMFQKDRLTSVGHLRHGTYLHNRRWNRYNSAFAFNPRQEGLPRAIVVDLDSPDARGRLENYHNVVQNLRLIKGGGINVWRRSRSDRQWSEAALGMDTEGRVLFLFSSQPFSMYELIEGVVSLGLGIDSLMHMEGGALASLSIRTKELDLDLAGVDGFTQGAAFTTGQWPIPNVIGVRGK